MKRFSFLITLSVVLGGFTFGQASSDSWSAQEEKMKSAAHCIFAVGTKSIGMTCRKNPAVLWADKSGISIPVPPGDGERQNFRFHQESRGSIEGFAHERIEVLTEACVRIGSCEEGESRQLLGYFLSACTSALTVSAMKPMNDEGAGISRVPNRLLSDNSAVSGVVAECGTQGDFIGYWYPLELHGGKFSIIHIISLNNFINIPSSKQ